LGRRLDTLGKKLVAVAAGIVTITGAVAGVRALLPHSSAPVNRRVVLDALDIQVGRPLGEFVAQRTTLSAQVSSVGPAAVAADGNIAAHRVAANPELAQESGVAPPEGGTETAPPSGEGETSPPSGEEGTLPPSTTPTTTEPRTTTLPSSAPGARSKKKTLCVEDTSTLPEAAVAPPTPSTHGGSPVPGAPNCQGVDYVVPASDLNKPPSELVQERKTLAHEVTSTWAVGRSCRRQPPPQTCPLASGIHPRVPRPGRRAAAALPPGTGRAPDSAFQPVSYDPPPAVVSAGAQRQAEAKSLAQIRMELKQLQNTRYRRGANGKREPLGVLVDYRLTLCGFAHHPVTVRWSLFDTKPPPKLPYLWVYQRPVASVTARASNCDAVEPNIWIPIPAIRGRFAIVLTVYDDHDTRIGKRTSSPFSSL